VKALKHVFERAATKSGRDPRIVLKLAEKAAGNLVG